MRILATGDLVGRPGRYALQVLLPQLRTELGLDLVIANGENLAGGVGITPDTAREVLGYGVDVITTGNHVWLHKDIIPYIDSGAPIVRPMNYPPGVPGRGYLEKNGVIVANLIGQTFMGSFDCPFRAMDHMLSKLGSSPHIIFVDFHAEATSEKVAMGRYLDGRVTAVLGTHTHVGTIDSMLLPGGTAYVTDIGMTGPMDSVIGDDVDAVLERFLTKMPRRITVGGGKTIFNAMLVDVDPATGQAKGIRRIQREVE
ncbi:MAG: YmdB family metallophosphoesterase [Chloroflexi bacterium]|nr:YmdB family metallophosphoesterase [Chloroflexota bacterium]